MNSETLKICSFERFVIACNQINRKNTWSCNAKEHYQSFIRKKNIKSIKQSKIVTDQPKTLENPNIVDTKPIITEHPKTSQKSSKTTRQAEKVSQVDFNNSLYSATKKSEKSFNEKMLK